MIASNLASIADRLFPRLGLFILDSSRARLLAAAGVGYLALAYGTDRAGGHYAKLYEAQFKRQERAGA